MGLVRHVARCSECCDSARLHETACVGHCGFKLSTYLVLHCQLDGTHARAYHFRRSVVREETPELPDADLIDNEEAFYIGRSASNGIPLKRAARSKSN